MQPAPYRTNVSNMTDAEFQAYLAATAEKREMDANINRMFAEMYPEKEGE